MRLLRGTWPLPARSPLGRLRSETGLALVGALLVGYVVLTSIDEATRLELDASAALPIALAAWLFGPVAGVAVLLMCLGFALGIHLGLGYSALLFLEEDALLFGLFAPLALLIGVMGRSTRAAGARAEAERRNAATLQTILEGTDRMIALFDGEGRIVHANAAYRAAFGERNVMEDVVADVLRTRVARSGREAPMTGSRYWDWSARPVAAGGPGVVVTGFETTAYRAERRMRERTDREHRKMVETAAEGIWRADGHGRTVFANARLCAMLGVDRATLDARHVLEFVHPDERATLQRMLSPGGLATSVELETRLLRADGTPFWVLLSAAKMLDDDGGYDGGVALVTDISERKRHEAELAENDARFRQVADSVREAIFLVSADLREVAYVSPAFTTLTGRSVDELRAAPLETIVGVFGEDVEKIRELLPRVRAGEVVAAELRYVGAAGDTRVCRMRAFPVHARGDGVYRIAGVVEDVTDAREAEAREREAERQATEIAQLRSLSDFKSGFLNMAAHELATPLTPLRLQLDMLRGGTLGPLVGDQQVAVDILHRNLARLSSLVEDLLDAARLDSGRLRLKPEPMTLADAAAQAHATFSPTAAAAGIELTLDVEAASRGRIVADPRRVGQMLVNLVDNAIKFTPRGGRVAIRLREHRGEALLTVTDTGVGLTPEQRSRLFQPFGQVHDATPRGRTGTGLGLFITKGLAAQHGGRVWCESDGPGRGSTFGIALPLAADSHDGERSPTLLSAAMSGGT